MSQTWVPITGYEVAYVNTEWLVLQRGGGYSAYVPPELSLTVVAVCNDRDRAFKVRDALRASIPDEADE